MSLYRGCNMSSFFCCLHEHDDAVSSSSNCLCLKCFFLSLTKTYLNLFSGGQVRAVSTPNQRASSSNSGIDSHNPSDASWPHGGAWEKGNHPWQVQPKPAEENSKFLLENNKHSGCSSNFFSLYGYGCKFPSPDDEDVCPTCLEDYTEENPKIMTVCSHHYHLSCIYEWMERSENCPVCGKLMQFDE